MKQGHLLVMFLSLYMICFVTLYVEQTKYDRVLEEKQKVEYALLDAVFVAAENYKKVINETEETKKNVVADSFMESLCVALGGLVSEEETAFIKMHIPLLVLAEEDGICFYFMQESQTEKGAKLQHIWSDKIPYGGLGQYSMADMIENMAAEIVSNHNYIASQFGITYRFHAPEFLQNEPEIPQFPMLFVVFQGWPLYGTRDVYYENCIDASIYIRENAYYTILGPDSLLKPYCVYHQPLCPLIRESSNIQKKRATKEEAIETYGAYPCFQCIKE